MSSRYLPRMSTSIAAVSTVALNPCCVRLRNRRRLVPRTGEHDVGESPVRDIRGALEAKPVPRRDSGPDRLLVGHERAQAHGSNGSCRHAEVRGEQRPDIAPAEGVAVDDVESLVRAPRVGGGPLHRAGQEAHVGHVQRGVEGSLAARENAAARRAPSGSLRRFPGSRAGCSGCRRKRRRRSAGAASTTSSCNRFWRAMSASSCS